MTHAERNLVWFLRLEAIVLLCAFPFALLPTEHMATIHAYLGLGELPRTPLVEYLTRSLSLVYAGWGPILLVLSREVKRYLPVLWVFAWLSVAFVPTLLVLDVVSDMPLSWTLAEAVSVSVFAGLTLLFVWRLQNEQRRIAS
jgi:hypothetical protein